MAYSKVEFIPATLKEIREVRFVKNDSPRRMADIDDAVRELNTLKEFKPIKVKPQKLLRTAGWWAFSKYSIQ